MYGCAVNCSWDKTPHNSSVTRAQPSCAWCGSAGIDCRWQCNV